ncbi:hypothetical protein CVT26_008434, partial [Gymnopilus dilepis]
DEEPYVEGEILLSTTLSRPRNQDCPLLDIPTEYDILASELKREPQCPEYWHKLINIAEDSEDMEKIMNTYDAFLLVYPNNAFAQVRCLDHLLQHNLFEKAEIVFKRTLPESSSVNLWKRYINHVRSSVLSTISAPSQRHTIVKSYEYTLSHIGQDSDSWPIWNDYIDFLRNEPNHRQTTVEGRQALRKVYHSAVQVPLNNVDRLWKELETMELLLDDVNASDTLASLSSAHRRALDVLQQLDSFKAVFDPPRESGVFLPPLPTFSSAERGLVGKWKGYLKWEESNPLGFDEQNTPTLHLRIRMAYRKAVMYMPYHTEFWFMAYDWMSKIGSQEEAMSMLTTGLKANPSSYLLTFALAEAFEIRMKYEDVHTTYMQLLSNLRERLGRSKNAGKTSLCSSQTTTGKDPKKVDSDQTTELSKRRTEYGLVWVMYMRFGMRVGGSKALRSIFEKVRRDNWATWETYDASAMMEYHCTGDKDIASRIYEKGMAVFGREVEYVLRYLEFLISINDLKNAQVVFERAVQSLVPEHAGPLWQRWLKHQYMYGDLEDILKLEKRMAKHNSSGIDSAKDIPAVYDKIKRFAQRYCYLGTDAVADRDLGFAIVKREAALINDLHRVNLSGTRTDGKTEVADDSSRRQLRSAVDKEKTGAAYAATGHRYPGRYSPYISHRIMSREGAEKTPGYSSRYKSSLIPAPSMRNGRMDGNSAVVDLPQVLSQFLATLPCRDAFDGQPVFL